MAEESENLVLKMLRELRKHVEDGQDTTSTGTGFAMHASIRPQALNKEIADLRPRVDQLERAN